MFIDTGNQATSCVDEPACHRREDGRSSLRLEMTDPIDYTTNYNIVTRFLNCGTPEASPMLTKPLEGVAPHGGGDLFAPGSASEMLFMEWFFQ